MQCLATSERGKFLVMAEWGAWCDLVCHVDHACFNLEQKRTTWFIMFQHASTMKRVTVKCKWFLITAICFGIFCAAWSNQETGKCNPSKMIWLHFSIEIKIDLSCIAWSCHSVSVVLSPRSGLFHYNPMFSANECLLQAVLSVWQWRWYATIGLTWHCCVTPCHLEPVPDSCHSFAGALRKI